MIVVWLSKRVGEPVRDVRSMPSPKLLTSAPSPKITLGNRASIRQCLNVFGFPGLQRGKRTYVQAPLSRNPGSGLDAGVCRTN